MIQPAATGLGITVMDIQRTLILTRSLERILVSLIGAMAIFLGYKLFATATTAEGVANFKFSEVTIAMSHTYPGVFFALFGAALIVFTAMRPVEWERKNAKGDESEEESIRSMIAAPQFSIAAPAPNEVATEGVVKSLADMANGLDTTPASIKRKVALREARVALMGSGWKREWGRTEDFRDWVYNFAEGDPPPLAIAKAVAVYRGASQAEG
ncbi:MAG TPA: hypothetical protein VMU01_10030 [Rhizomicrobium sp.]|nr:hypothetical protein [Rhizomicrobium sp.]